MPTYRFTMGFRQSGRTATETYYHEAVSLTEAATLAEQLVTARNACLFDTTEWVGVRIGVADLKRAAQLYRPGAYTAAIDGLTMTLPAKGILTILPGKAGVDIGETCIQMTLRYQDNRSTKRYFSFVPDDCVSGTTAEVVITAHGGFSDGYIAFRSLIVGQEWKIRAKEHLDTYADKTVLKWVQSAEEPAPAAAVIHTNGAPAIAVGDKVSIKGVRRKGPDDTSYNGEWIVKSVVDDATAQTRSVYLLNSEGIDATSIKNNGTLQLVKHGYFDIQAWSWYQAGAHKRGVSFGASRGRRLTRRALAH